jgi:hypothetical protein
MGFATAFLYFIPFVLLWLLYDLNNARKGTQKTKNGS